MVLNKNIPFNGQNTLYLHSIVRLRAFFHFDIFYLAGPRSFSTGLFLFGYLPDSRAKDLCLSLTERSVSLRGWQGNDQDDHWFRPQKGRGDIRGAIRLNP
jgi:hypothetical protein